MVRDHPGGYSFNIVTISLDTPYEYDDGFTASSSTKMPDVVVFSDSRQKPPEHFSKAQKKAFMASHNYVLPPSYTDTRVNSLQK